MERGRFTASEALAFAEVTTETAESIEWKTAVKWAERAIACYKKAESALDAQAWIVRAEDAKGEALEHAAKVMDEGESVKRIQKYIEGRS